MVKANLKAKISADAAQFNRALKDIKNQTKSFTKTASVAFAGVGSAAILALGKASLVFASFEKKMLIVKAVTNANNKEFSALNNKAKELGKTTTFSASQVADGMKFLGQAGYSTAQILKTIPTALKLAKAGSLDLGQTSDIITDLSTAFGLTADKALLVGDVIAKSATSAAMDIPQMAEAMKYVASSAKIAGISIEETAASIATLANAGIKGSIAGTSLNQMLNKLTKESTQLDLKKNFNVDVLDAAGNIRNLNSIIKDLSASMQGMTGANKLKELNNLFDVRAGRAVAVLIDNLGENFNSMNQKIKNSSGALEKMNNTMSQGTENNINKLLSAFESFQIAIGEALQQDIESLINAITKMINYFSKLIKENKELVPIVTKLAFGLVALGAGLQGILGTVAAVKFFKNISTAMKTFSAATNVATVSTITLNKSLLLLSGQAAAIIAVAAAAGYLGNELGKLIGTDKLLGGTFYEMGKAVGVFEKEQKGLAEPIDYVAKKTKETKTDIEQIVKNKKNEVSVTEKLKKLEKEKSDTAKKIADAEKKKNNLIKKIADAEKELHDNKVENIKKETDELKKQSQKEISDLNKIINLEKKKAEQADKNIKKLSQKKDGDADKNIKKLSQKKDGDFYDDSRSQSKTEKLKKLEKEKKEAAEKVSDAMKQRKNIIDKIADAEKELHENKIDNIKKEADELKKQAQTEIAELNKTIALEKKKAEQADKNIAKLSQKKGGDFYTDFQEQRKNEKQKERANAKRKRDEAGALERLKRLGGDINNLDNVKGLSRKQKAILAEIAKRQGAGGNIAAAQDNLIARQKNLLNAEHQLLKLKFDKENEQKKYFQNLAKSLNKMKFDLKGLNKIIDLQDTNAELVTQSKFLEKIAYKVDKMAGLAVN